MVDRLRASISCPWHLRAPENPQCPTTVHAENSQIVWLAGNGAPIPRANPLLAQPRGASVAPVTGGKRGVAMANQIWWL